MSDASQSPIKMTRALQDAVNNAGSAAEVAALMHAAGIEQGVISVGRDGEFVNDQPQPQKVNRSVTVEGRTFSVEGDTQAEVDAKIAEVIRSVQPNPTEQGRRAEAAAASEEEAEAARLIALTELDLKFKRGEISAADYIEQSGAVKNYLESQGVPLEILREKIHGDQAEKQAEAAIVSSWESATQRFLKSCPDWVGGAVGENNIMVMAAKIAELGLIDAEDKFQAMVDAWNALKKTGVYYTGKASVSPDGSPGEIMQAWKNAIKLEGGDENAHFSTMFGTK